VFAALLATRRSAGANPRGRVQDTIRSRRIRIPAAPPARQMLRTTSTPALPPRCARRFDLPNARQPTLSSWKCCFGHYFRIPENSLAFPCPPYFWLDRRCPRRREHSGIRGYPRRRYGPLRGTMSLRLSRLGDRYIYATSLSPRGLATLLRRGMITRYAVWPLSIAPAGRSSPSRLCRFSVQKQESAVSTPSRRAAPGATTTSRHRSVLRRNPSGCQVIVHREGGRDKSRATLQQDTLINN
jgi:hypothetical protein